MGITGSRGLSASRAIARRFLLAALCTVAAWEAAMAGPVVVKLATVAPAGSIWHQYLQEVDADWRRLSSDQVRLKIYAGTLGDEDDIVRRMRIGQIDAATMSTTGLGSVDEAARALYIPMAFASHEELDHVRGHMAPRMEEALRDKGFVVLNWGDAGWVHFFTKSPVQRPADLRKERLFVWAAGEPTVQERLWKQLGFQPVALSVVDIIPALQTGMVTAYQAPPIAALANQWFPFTGWMTDLRWGPLTGATVISARTWSTIPPELRPALMHSARAAGERLRERVRRQEQEAIEAMTKRGLEVVEVPPDAYREWEMHARSVYPEIRGGIVPAAHFDEALRLRDEYRAASAAHTSRTE